jgi:hypothetical protein
VFVEQVEKPPQYYVNLNHIATSALCLIPCQHAISAMEISALSNTVEPMVLFEKA